MKKQCLTFLIPALLFSACKVSKNVQLPDMQLPAAYRSAMSTDTIGIGTLPLKSFFTDVVLQNLLDSAISGNYDLQIALKNIEQAQLAFEQARLGNLPGVSLAGTASLNRPSDNSLNGLSLSQYLGSKYIEDYTLGANISWEADIWDKIKSRKAAALAAYLQTTEARKLIQTQIVTSVSQGYYNLLMLDAQLKIARKNLLLNDSTLTIIRLQYDAGQVTSLAVQQVTAQEQTAAALIPEFEQQITVQENALRILAGKLPAGIRRDATLETTPLPANLPAGLPSRILSLRPDVRSAELAVDRRNAEVGFAKAQLYPSLTITAQGGVNSYLASNWFNLPASLFGVVMGGLTQPLFEGKALRTTYETEKVEREKSVILFRQTVITAVGEVSNVLVRIDKLNQQEIVIASRTGTLRQATANADMLFRNGLANYLEVITAQSNVLQSELELATIKKAQLNAVVDLYRSVGGGWN